MLYLLLPFFCKLQTNEGPRQTAIRGEATRVKLHSPCFKTRATALVALGTGCSSTARDTTIQYSDDESIRSYRSSNGKARSTTRIRSRSQQIAVKQEMAEALHLRGKHAERYSTWGHKQNSLDACLRGSDGSRGSYDCK